MTTSRKKFHLSQERLGDLPLPQAISYAPREPLNQIIKAMQTNSTGSVIIQSGEKLVGIFTERDFITRVLGREVLLQEPVEEFMTRDPVTLTVDHSLEDAVLLMIQKGIRHIPLLGENKKAEKIISVRDVIDYLAEWFPQEVLNLPPDPDQMARHEEGG